MFEYFKILESLVVAVFNNIYFFFKKALYVQQQIGKATHLEYFKNFPQIKKLWLLYFLF